MFSRSDRRGTWLVTGAASGFGRAIAQRLDLSEVSLALWDRNGEGLEETRASLGRARAHTEIVDVSDPDRVREAFASSEAALGSIARVIHCAGVLSVGPAESLGPHEYRRMIEINYLGSVHVALAALPSLRAQRGALCFVASVAGLRGFPELAGYSASKFAVLGFAQALADELEGSGVRVKVLCPPPGDTPMLRDLPKLPPIYRLSPLFSADRVATVAIREIDRPGLVALVDARSKLLWRVSRAVPALLDVIVRASR
jgi:NAD(P)-dependent dehydrogenase (short-subunit alcohol dehydrogenase family)